MKKIIITLLIAIQSFACIYALDFKSIDKILLTTRDYDKCIAALNDMLPQAQAGSERAQVLWNLSKYYMLKGEVANGNAAKREAYAKGIDYANKCLAEEPGNENGYLWRCANVGRDCQTRSVMEQTKKVGDMLNDLTAILDKLGKTDCGEAWQAIAEIYYQHPFKSSDAAACFTRKAITCIPKGEPRVSTYVLLARILIDRGWSASKRASEIAKDAPKFEKGYKSNLDKFSYFDGKQGADFVPAWSKASLGSMSDSEEAAALLAYAESLYNGIANKTLLDEKDYKELKETKAKLK